MVLGSDHASIMKGSRTSVFTMLKAEYNYLFGIHYFSHSFNLLAESSSKALLYCLDKFIKMFYPYYDFS